MTHQNCENQHQEKMPWNDSDHATHLSACLSLATCDLSAAQGFKKWTERPQSQQADEN